MKASLASHNNLSQLGETEQEGKVGNVRRDVSD